MRELTTGHYLAGEVWVKLITSKTIFYTASILRPDIATKGIKQISEENAETSLRLKLESSEHN